MKNNAIYERKNGMHVRKNSFLSRNVKSGSRICDLFCGEGLSIEFVRELGNEICGVDNSDEMTAKSRERFKGEKKIKIIKATAEDTGLEAGHFDYVIARMGFHHVSDKGKVLKEAARILRKDGKLIVMDKFVSPTIMSGLAAKMIDAYRNIFFGIPRHEHDYTTLKDFIRIAKTNGFGIMHTHEHKKWPIVRANIVFFQQD